MVYETWETILSNRLTPILNLLTSESQTEYKNSRSTMGAISILRKNIKNDNATGLVLIDLSKAFGAIGGNLLWAILYEKGIPCESIRLIRMGHTNNQLRPKYKGALGTCTRKNRGVFQRSPLSAMIFNTYFDSMMRDYTQNLQGGINIGESHNCKSHLGKNTPRVTTSSGRNSEAKNYTLIQRPGHT